MDKSFEKLINRVLDGRYRIESVVGIGGMAYVLRAADMQNSGRPVAIKVLNEEFNRDENAVKRFVNESETIAMVDSPNIVKIYDVAISDNLKYIVMEFIDGITLKDYIDKVGKLGWKEAVHYVRQILTGLAHAHEKGIIHRDIKPQNVMLLRDGKVKVTDFGIAKSPTSEPLTMTDKAIGTVNYISPEQASGEPVDKKSDVYSVGVMLYEMLTGTLPFTADSPVAVAMMQVNDEPVPPREHNSQIPVGLEQIVLKAMSKKPEERFNCATSMEKALEYFVKNPDIVFSGTPSTTASSDKARSKSDTKEKKKSKSMFPIILGVTLSFFIVVAILLAVVFFSSGGSSGGLASALDKILGVESKNSEEKKMVVDDFTGLVYNEEILDTIQDMGYVVSVKETEYSNIEDGIIVSQEPEGGDTIIKKKKIDLVVYVNRNDGGANRIMPDCVGIPKNSAIEQIVRKFSPDITKSDIEIVEEFNQTHVAGTVYDCIPQVGDEVDLENGKIIIYVSKGKKMKMPMIIDKTEGEVRQILSDEGIRYRIQYEESDVTAGTVLDASIGTGMEVLETDTVIVTVSKKMTSKPSAGTPEAGQQNTPSSDNGQGAASGAEQTPETDTQPSTPSQDGGIDSLLGMRADN